METRTRDGLRERKKAETRQALHEAALRLAVERGFDQLTVDAVTDAAGVSRRTFSNYFADKAEAVLYGEEQRTRRLVEAVRARPAGEPGWTAMRAAFHDVHDPLGPGDPVRALRARLLRRHPTLLSRQLGTYAELEKDLARAVEERGAPGGVAARTAAATFLLAVRLAFQTWTEQNEPGLDLGAVADGFFDQIARPFG